MTVMRMRMLLLLLLLALLPPSTVAASKFTDFHSLVREPPLRHPSIRKVIFSAGRQSQSQSQDEHASGQATGAAGSGSSESQTKKSLASVNKNVPNGFAGLGIPIYASEKTSKNAEMQGDPLSLRNADADAAKDDDNGPTSQVVFSWGHNSNGQLGLGHHDSIATPTAISTLQSKYPTRAGAGSGFSIMTTTSGLFFGSGRNDRGQLGTGDSVSYRQFVQLKFTANVAVRQIQCGEHFTLVLLEDGTVMGWGDNSLGQLGNNASTIYTEPVQLQFPAKIVMISAGREHALAIDRDNRLWVWGSNARGQLGMEAMMLAQLDGANRKGSAMFKPFRTASGGIHGLKFKHASAGWEFTVVVSQGGEVYTWGANEKGQLGLGDTKDHKIPMQVPNRYVRGTVESVSGGRYHTLATTDTGDVFAWGWNTCGELGRPILQVEWGEGGEILKNPRNIFYHPAKIEGLRSRAAVAGNGFSVAANDKGQFFVWGCPGIDEFESGDPSQLPKPKAFHLNEERHFIDFAIGVSHVLVITPSQELYGWGSNADGELLTTLMMEEHMGSRKPLLLNSPNGMQVEFIAAGGWGSRMESQSLAGTISGDVYGWGCNAKGQLGNGELSDVNSKPLLIDSISLAGLKEFHFGHDFTLLRTTLDTTHFVGFGSGLFGQLGDGVFQSSPVLDQIQKEPARDVEIKQMATGYGHTLLLSEDGRLFAWGLNAFGQLGHGDTKDRNRPTLVQSFAIISSASPVVYIACGPFSSYAINANGRVFSWGLNENYELGLGQGMSRTSPQLIRFFDDNNISIKRIIPGGFHVLAVSDEGNLYAWGSNEYGQTAIGYNINAPFVETPSLISGLEGGRVSDSHKDSSGREIASVAAGMWHTVAILDSGDVYSWGRGDHCQLGNLDCSRKPDTHVRPNEKPWYVVDRPQKIPSFENVHPLGVVCGAAHTLLLAKGRAA